MTLRDWLSVVFFFFKQKTAYEMRISDWSSDVCSSDLDVDRLVRSRDQFRDDLVRNDSIAVEDDEIPVHFLARDPAGAEIVGTLQERVEQGADARPGVAVALGRMIRHEPGAGSGDDDGVLDAIGAGHRDLPAEEGVD